MGITIRQVTQTCVDAATQDFTVSGLGAASEIKGAIIMWSRWDGSVGATSDHEFGFGVSDFTDDACTWSTGEDGVSSENADRCLYDLYSLVLSRAGTPTLIAVATASAITDGVRLTYSDQAGGDAGDYKITVVILADTGSDLKVLVGGSLLTTTVGGTTDVTTTGVDPDTVIGFTSHGPFGTVGSHANLSLGWAVDEGSSPPAQDGYKWMIDNGSSAGDPKAVLSPTDSNRWILRNMNPFNGVMYTAHQISSMGTDKFTVKGLHNAGTNYTMGWMAIEGVKTEVVTQTLKTSTGEDDVLFDDFTEPPQFVLGMLTRLASRNSVASNATAGSWAMFAADGTDVVTHGASDQDAKATVQVYSHYDDSQACLTLDTGATGWKADVEFNNTVSSRMVLDFTSSNGATAHAFYLGFEAASSTTEASGEGVWPDAEGDGTSTLEIQASGEGVWPDAEGGGTSTLEIQASGEGVWPDATGTGTAEVGIQASGEGVWPDAEGGGTSTLEIQASGEGVWPDATGTGVAEPQTDITQASGEGVWPDAEGGGTSTLEIQASGEGAWPDPVGAGASTLELQASGEGIWPDATGTGVAVTGDEATEASGEGVWPDAEGSGSATSIGGTTHASGEGAWPNAQGDGEGAAVNINHDIKPPFLAADQDDYKEWLQDISSEVNPGNVDDVAYAFDQAMTGAIGARNDLKASNYNWALAEEGLSPITPDEMDPHWDVLFNFYERLARADRTFDMGTLYPPQRHV